MVKRHYRIYFSILILLLIVPFAVAYFRSDRLFVFSGFLLNPIDGNSYLAKMQIGARGEWLFSLPFTSEPGQGSFLFVFYILLGHLASLLSLPNLFMFHLARILSSAFLMIELIRFCEFYLAELPAKMRGMAFFLLSAGSGLGWLLAFWGQTGADTWIAEMYPFLSMLVNPHFPLGLALLLDLLLRLERISTINQVIVSSTEALLLAFINPFAVVVFIFIGFGYLITERLFSFGEKVMLIGGLCIPAGCALLYQYFQTVNQPVLAIWNSQNLTISPDFGNVLLSLSPVIIVVIIGFGVLLKNRNLSFYPNRMLWIWAFGGLLLAYAPFSLQRRFLLGLFVPLAILAVLLIAKVFSNGYASAKRIVLIVLGFSVITNILLLSGVANAIIGKNSSLYFPADEIGIYQWMNAAEPGQRPIILVPEEVGNRVPAYTQWRVLYGHPFETANARLEVDQVRQFYSGQMSVQAMNNYLLSRNIQYIWADSTISENTTHFLQSRPVVKTNGNISIYAIKP